MNAQGKLLLRGSSGYGDFVQQNQASDDGRTFAIASSHFDKPVNRTTQMHLRDYNNLAVRVFDTASAKQRASIVLQQGSPQEDTMALAPDGASVAVLTSKAVQLFPITAAP